MVPGLEMSLFRSLSASLLSAAVTFSIVTASGCGTSAVGIDDCRAIEQARCRAAAPCGLVDDVAACERYYRDHCLHGLLTDPPPGTSVADCVRAIEAAGQCASRDPESPLSECTEDVPEARPGLSSACAVVEHPERAEPCSFLLVNPDDNIGSGGMPAAGGQTGSEPEPEDPVAGAGGQTAQAGAPAE